MDTILSHNLTTNSDFTTDVDIFLRTINIENILETNGAKKRNGIPTQIILKDSMEAIINQDSMFMNMEVLGKTGYGKDAYYRMLGREQSHWAGIQTMTAKRVFDKLTSDIEPFEEKSGVFIIDDTPYSRPDSKHTELVSSQFNHATGGFFNGFRNSSLSYFNYGVLVNINNVPVSTTDETKPVKAAKDCKPGSTGQMKRQLSTSKLNDVCFTQVDWALAAGFQARYTTFDSWFCHPSTLVKVLDRDMDAVGMVKSNGNTLYEIEGQLYTIRQIYLKYGYRVSLAKNKRIIFSIIATANCDNRSFPVKLVFCEAVGQKKDFICILSTDTDLSDDAVVRIYGIRWNDELIFSDIKSSELDVERTNQCLSLDAVWAGIAIVALVHLFLTYLKAEAESESIISAFYLAKEGQNSVDSLNLLLKSTRKILTFVSESHQINFDLLNQEIADLFRLDQVVLNKEKFIFLLRNKSA